MPCISNAVSFPSDDPKNRNQKAYLAVEKVLAQSLSDSTESAVGAMVDGLVRVVVPELAYPAVVVGRRLAALGACIGCLLCAPAEHAEHVFGLLAREDVILDSVVTVAARVPPLTRPALQLDIPAVVLAAEALLLLFLGLSRHRPPVRAVSRPLVRRKRRPEVLLGQGQVERA